MTQTILIILGVAIVAILLTRKTREKAIGICAAALGLEAKRRENRPKVLKKEKGCGGDLWINSLCGFY